MPGVVLKSPPAVTTPSDDVVHAPKGAVVENGGMVALASEASPCCEDELWEARVSEDPSKPFLGSLEKTEGVYHLP